MEDGQERYSGQDDQKLERQFVWEDIGQGYSARIHLRYEVPACLRPTAIIDVGAHGRWASMRRNSHTIRSKFLSWDRLTVLCFKIFPFSHHPGREMRLKRSIALKFLPVRRSQRLAVAMVAAS